jgi:hypothetical protein
LKTPGDVRTSLAASQRAARRFNSIDAHFGLRSIIRRARKYDDAGARHGEDDLYQTIGGVISQSGSGEVVPIEDTLLVEAKFVVRHRVHSSAAAGGREITRTISVPGGLDAVVGRSAPTPSGTARRHFPRPAAYRQGFLGTEANRCRSFRA